MIRFNVDFERHVVAEVKRASLRDIIYVTILLFAYELVFTILVFFIADVIDYLFYENLELDLSRTDGKFSVISYIYVGAAITATRAVLGNHIMFFMLMYLSELTNTFRQIYWPIRATMCSLIPHILLVVFMNSLDDDFLGISGLIPVIFEPVVLISIAVFFSPTAIYIFHSKKVIANRTN